jgi:hypothetical protein
MAGGGGAPGWKVPHRPALPTTPSGQPLPLSRWALTGRSTGSSGALDRNLDVSGALGPQATVTPPAYSLSHSSSHNHTVKHTAHPAQKHPTGLDNPIGLQYGPSRQPQET